MNSVKAGLVEFPQHQQWCERAGNTRYSSLADIITTKMVSWDIQTFLQNVYHLFFGILWVAADEVSCINNTQLFIKYYNLSEDRLLFKHFLSSFFFFSFVETWICCTVVMCLELAQYIRFQRWFCRVFPAICWVPVCSRP